MPFDENRKLFDKALKLLDASDEDRIAYLDQPIFIPYSRSADLLLEMEDLLSHPKTHRMPNLT